MKDTWCPTCSKPVSISLDCFPALCSDCRQPYFVAQRPGGYAQGRADERAAIVVWLRAITTEYSVLDDAADEIERGEHEKKKP